SGTCGGTIQFQTLQFDIEDIFAITIPTFLLILGALVIFLSVTVYRSNIFPVIPNPSKSLVGKWLLETQHEIAPKLLQLEGLSALHVPSDGYYIQVKPSELSVITVSTGQTQLAVQHDYI
ncbi:hypothetical protein Z043_102929, partial [Scleropages formosus]